ncbi:MAG TPA: L-seryl-tRNA(Sec) selenium transferase, partial [Phycisphaerae bacterium]|nr:L-seryl-tRNA(Sec) selenium transferase [Phycisphaerae bacterium]
EATLGLFFDESMAMREIPTLAMLSRSPAQIDEQAERIAAAVRSQVGGAADVQVIDGSSQMGSGSLPTQNLPTRLVALAPASMAPDDLAARLRRHAPPVFARIQDDRVLVDPRTLLPADEAPLIEALVAALAPKP